MDNKNKMAKALSELADEMNSFSELSGEIRDLKEVITDSNEELIATFVEGTKRILKKETKDNTRDIKSLESSVVESLNSLKRGIAEVERGVKAIKLPSNTDFRATGAMLKLPIKELTRTIEGFKLSKKPEDAIPVRLSDGENFYKALDQIVQYATGGGGSSYAFDTQQSSPTKAATVKVSIDGKDRDAIVVVNPDGTEVGGGSSGGGLTDAELRASPVPITGSITVDTTGLATDTKQDTIIGHLDGVEGILTTIDADTGSIKTALETAGGLVVNLGANNDVTVTGTVDLGATDNAVLDTIAAKDFATQTTLAAMNAKMVSGTDIGDVTINNASGASAVNIQDGGNTITVDGTVAVTNSDITSIKTAVEIIDNAISGSEMQVDVVGALPAGTNAIGKLAANSGVDIGDVDVTSISAGTNLIGDVGIQPRTTNGLDTFMASGSDGSSILVATAQAVKASAGKVYGYYLYNPESAVTFVHFYNTASGSVTVGTTSPLFTLQVPPASAANLMSEIGITFGTAITIAATTTAGGNTAPATGVSATIWFK